MNTTDPSPGVDRDNPWPGLASFTEDLRDFFFGRTRETAELFRLTARDTLTVLFGQSGLGKTSLLQAGLFPRLRAADFVPIYVRLDHDPKAFGLAYQVKAAIELAITDRQLDAPAWESGETLWEYFHRQDAAFWTPMNRPATPVIVLDQFEELFTLGRASDAARARGQAFLEEFADLVENRTPTHLLDADESVSSRYQFGQPRCKVLLSLREDYLPELEAFRPQIKSVLQNTIRITRMTGAAALEVLEKPGTGLLDSGVSQRIVRFVAGARAASDGRPIEELEVEPALLSVVCRELNTKRQAAGQAVISADLLAGNRREILADFYERSIADLPPAARRFIEDRLLTRSGYRDTVALENAVEEGLERGTIDLLVSRRLLRIEDRLGVPRVELAHDVLAEPVRATRDARKQRREVEEAAERERRIVEQLRRARRRTRVTLISIAAMAVLVALSVGYAVSVSRQQKAVGAHGLVKLLIACDTAQVPYVVNEISAYRQWADPLLRRENSAAAPDSREKLRTSLGLLPVDAGQVDYVYGRLLTAEPNEVPVLRDALFAHSQGLLDRLWAVVQKPEKGKESTRLRAAAALAKYDPDAEQWTQCSPQVVNDLVEQSPVFFGQWSDAFRPVKNRLLPALSAIFRDLQTERSAERNLATNLLVDYAADEPPVLADLLMDADEKQFAAIFPKFAVQAEGGLPILTSEIDQKLAPDSTDDAKERLAKRQANAAVALLRFNQPGKVWPLLQHTPDPRTRSYLIHRLSPLGADPEAVIRRLDEEPDISIRRALILSLGEFGEQDLSPEQRKLLIPKLQEAFRTTPDPGLHAAVEWLLRNWGQDAWLAEVNDQWAKDDTERSRKLKGLAAATQPTAPATPQWYVNNQGQTMVTIPGPVEFMMGSPETEANRTNEESQHKVRIGRTFAIAAKAVTFEQYRKYTPDYDVGIKVYTRMPNLPVNGTSWYQAAAYCNWLSQEEGIPRDQWSYEIADVDLLGIRAGQAGVAIKLKEHYLSSTGYRLPTEAEMEYATRAGAITSRYYGETDELLPKYAWFNKNSDEKTWPVGSKKPNDLGFFDSHGNVWCWCQEPSSSYPESKNNAQAIEDVEQELDISSIASRALRGGSFNVRASDVRSACRGGNVPSNRVSDIGFRVARTLQLGRFTSLPPPAGSTSK